MMLHTACICALFYIPSILLRNCSGLFPTTAVPFALALMGLPYLLSCPSRGLPTCILLLLVLCSVRGSMLCRPSGIGEMLYRRGDVRRNLIWVLYSVFSIEKKDTRAYYTQVQEGA